VLKAKEVRRALLEKGFKEDRKRDHCFYFYYHCGKKTNIYTKISHGTSDISDRIRSAMARQARLTNAEFTHFVDCTLTGEGYRELLVRNGHLAPE